MRHGRTSLNVDGHLRGHLDPPLDAVGEAEAAALGRLFASTPISRVVTSPLQRASATARAIADACECELQVEDGFIDRDYGRFAGRSLAELEASAGPLETLPGVERHRDFEDRVLGSFARTAATVSEPTAIVAHDAVNRLLLRDLCGRADVDQATGCWNRIDTVDDGVTWAAEVVGARPGDGRRP